MVSGYSAQLCQGIFAYKWILIPACIEFAGEHQLAVRLDSNVTILLRSIFEKKRLKIRNPLATRPWQHVLEPLHGYMLLALELEKDPNTFSGSWNFGPEPKDIKTVGEIIKIARDLNFNLTSTKVAKKNKEEAQSLSLDISKVKNELNFTPRWNAMNAIKRSLEWYQKFYDGEIPSTLIDNDLKTFNLKT